MMYKLEVYSQEFPDMLVGTGYVFYHKYGMTQPTLVTLTGEYLPEGWYNLKVVSTGELVVMNSTRQ